MRLRQRGVEAVGDRRAALRQRFAQQRRHHLQSHAETVAVFAVGHQRDAGLTVGRQDLPIPDWVWGVTRMTFVSPGHVPQAAKAGARRWARYCASGG